MVLAAESQDLDNGGLWIALAEWVMRIAQHNSADMRARIFSGNDGLLVLFHRIRSKLIDVVKVDKHGLHPEPCQCLLLLGSSQVYFAFKPKSIWKAPYIGRVNRTPSPGSAMVNPSISHKAVTPFAKRMSSASIGVRGWKFRLTCLAMALRSRALPHGPSP